MTILYEMDDLTKQQAKVAIEGYFREIEQVTTIPRAIEYKDGLVCRKQVCANSGLFLEEFAVLDEEVVFRNEKKFWRRLRSSKTPSRIHYETPLIPLDIRGSIDLDKPMLKEGLVFMPICQILNSHEKAMMHGMTTLAPFLKSPSHVRVLGLGATLGYLMGYLKTEFHYAVECFDGNREVIAALKEYFLIPAEIQECDPLDVIAEIHAPGSNSGQRMENLRSKGLLASPFDVLMLDVKSFEDGTRTGLCAPPRNFISIDLLKMIKGSLKVHGALIVHVLAPDYVFKVDLIKNLREVFSQVYTVDVGGDITEFVLVATSIPVEEDSMDSEVSDIKERFEIAAAPFSMEEIMDL